MRSRVGMEGEDDRLVPGEKLVEIHVIQSVRVLGLRLQPHQVDDVDHPDFQIEQMLAHNGDRGERLQRQRPLQQRIVIEINLADR